MSSRKNGPNKKPFHDFGFAYKFLKNNGFVKNGKKLVFDFDKGIESNKKKINKFNYNGKTILEVAIEKKLSLGHIKYLIHSGAMVNRYNSKGIAPIVHAINHNRADVALLFIKNMADINIPIYSKKQQKAITIYEFLGGLKKEKKLSKGWIKVLQQLEKLGANNHSDLCYIPNPPIRNLIIEGGGAKGACYPGAVYQLEKSGMLKDLKRVAGSSAGGIVALLMALGTTGKELVQGCSELDFEIFKDMDGKSGFARFISGVRNLFTKSHGWFEGKAFKSWACEAIKFKLKPYGLDENATFADLAKLVKKNPKFKLLYLTGTNITRNKREIFSAEHTPKMKLVDAVRITMSMPGVFKSYFMKKDGEEERYVDGGNTNNFPADIFDSHEYLQGEDRIYCVNKCGNNPTTLGLRTIQPGDSHPDYGNNKDKVNGIFHYIKKVLTILRDSQYGIKKESHQTIWLSSAVTTLQFHMNSDIKKQMIKRSRQDVRDWVKQHRSVGTYYKVQGRRDPVRLEEKIKAKKEKLLKLFEGVLKMRKKEVDKVTNKDNNDGSYIKIRYANRRLVEIISAISGKKNLNKSDIEHCEKLIKQYCPSIEHNNKKNLATKITNKV